MKFFERRSFFMHKTINSKRTVAYFQGAGPTILPGILKKVVSEGEIMIFFGAGKVISFIKLVSRRKLFLILKKISQAIIVRRSRKKLLHYFRGRIVIIICWIMYVYHARQQTTYILQFWAQSIQTVRECKSYISCEIRHNYTIFDFGVQCRRINATPYNMGDPVWVGNGLCGGGWWVGWGGGGC